jgi:hypothetical protein
MVRRSCRQSNIGPGPWKLEIPNDQGVGVGGWRNSHLIPGQTISYDPEPVIIEIPQTRIRKLHENQPIDTTIYTLRRPSGGSTRETVKMPPWFSPLKTGGRQLATMATKYSAASATQINAGCRRLKGI